MNSVNLIGRLTRDPELVESKGGTSIVNFALALDRRERDQDPVYVEVKAFAGQADAIAEHKRKGDEVAVEGRLELDRWEAKDGSNRSRLYVVANRVQFLRNKRSEHNGADPASAEAASEDIPA